jgi:hypothetical protein
MSIKDIRKFIIFAFIIGTLHFAFAFMNFVNAEATMNNSHFTIEKVFAGKFEPSSMIFLAPDDILLLDRDYVKVVKD